MLEIILAGFIQWETIQTQIKEDNVSGIELSSYILHNDSDDNRVVIIPGDSVWQREERERISRELATKTSYTRGESYTGTGSQVEIIGESWEQCVIYFKRQKGISTSLGYAGNIKPNSQTPEVGEGALEWNHISLVVAVGDSWIKVRESNWLRGKITERVIPKSQVRGYLKV